jgi:hypothetical protein
LWFNKSKTSTVPRHANFMYGNGFDIPRVAAVHRFNGAP